MKNIPDEIKFKICLYLNTKSICTLSSVSKEWKSLAEDEHIWKGKLREISQYEDKTRSSKSIYSQIMALKRQNHKNLLSLAVMCTENAKLILQTPELFDEMNSYGLLTDLNIVTLAQSNPKTAEFIFKTPKFGLFIKTHDLFTIAKTNSQTAKLVLQNYVFAYDICNYDLFKIAEMYPDTKEIISRKYPQSAYLLRDDKMINRYLRENPILRTRNFR